MSAEQLNNIQLEEENDSSFDVKGYLHVCLRHWYLFLFSVVAFLAIGTLYVMKTTPVYTRSARIQVRDDSHGASLNNDFINSFSDLGMFSASADVYNELLAIKSPRLLARVVDELDLNVKYKHKKGLRWLPDYGTTLPFNVTFVDGGKAPLSLTITLPEDGNECTMSDFTQWIEGSKEEYDKVIKFDLMTIDTLDTPVGRVIVRPNASYSGARIHNEDIVVTYQSPESTVMALSEQIQSELADEHSTVIQLNYSDISPRRAEDVLNTLIDVYNRSWIEDRNVMARATSQFINERLVGLEGELSDVDSDISSYKSNNLVPDVEEASRIYLQQASRTSDEILDLNNQLQMARYVREYLQNPSHASTLLPANSGFGATSIDNQINDYNRLVLERNSLASSSSEANPRVKQYDKSIGEMRTAILSAIDNQIVALSTSIKSLQRSEAGATARLAANPSQAKYLLNIERQQKVKESLYLFLLQKREENELSQTFAPYNTRILMDATGHSTPVSPQRSSILILCFLLGVIIPAACLYVREILDTTVRSAADIEKTSLPMLGRIPNKGKKKTLLDRILRRNKDTDMGLVVAHGSTDVMNEAFRMLRSNFDFMTRNKGPKCRVIMVSSVIAASGKTFISMNLAAAMALKGEKVLLVDLDLRRHSLTNQLAGTCRQGVSSWLSGAQVTIDQLTVRNLNGINGLDLIPSGPVPPNPSELLLDGRMEQLIADAREHYDVVIVDCPPSEVVADARAIAHLCDYTLYIIRVGNLDRNMLPHVERMYAEKVFPNMTMVLNGTGSSEGGRYGYGYGYQYGYSK